VPSKELNQGTKVLFADGRERNIKPLTIKQLRKFINVIADLDPAKTSIDEKDIDTMVEAAKIVLARDYSDLANGDTLEDILDLKSFNELLAVAMGTDPNV